LTFGSEKRNSLPHHRPQRTGVVNIPFADRVTRSKCQEFGRGGGGERGRSTEKERETLIWI